MYPVYICPTGEKKEKNKKVTTKTLKTLKYAVPIYFLLLSQKHS